MYVSAGSEEAQDVSISPLSNIPSPYQYIWRAAQKNVAFGSRRKIVGFINRERGCSTGYSFEIALFFPGAEFVVRNEPKQQ